MSYYSDYAFAMRRDAYESQMEIYRREDYAGLFTNAYSKNHRIICGIDYVVCKGEHWKTCVETREESKLKEILSEAGGLLVIFCEELGIYDRRLLGSEHFSEEEAEQIEYLIYRQTELKVGDGDEYLNMPDPDSFVFEDAVDEADGRLKLYFVTSKEFSDEFFKERASYEGCDMATICLNIPLYELLGEDNYVIEISPTKKTEDGFEDVEYQYCDWKIGFEDVLSLIHLANRTAVQLFSPVVKITCNSIDRYFRCRSEAELFLNKEIRNSMPESTERRRYEYLLSQVSSGQHDCSDSMFLK